MLRRIWLSLLSFWPGLAQIWSGQIVLGLILAAWFSLALNLAVITHQIWTDVLDPRWSGFFLALAAATWLLGLAYTLWWIWRCHPHRHRDEIDQLYRVALESYLQGRWNDARLSLERVLTLDETDVDALMQLATLYARTHRPDHARRALRQALELDSKAKWRWELGELWKRVEESEAVGTPQSG
jgi:tetratricopeptide (TPR) repeat protein